MISFLIGIVIGLTLAFIFCHLVDALVIYYVDNAYRKSCGLSPKPFRAEVFKW
ncbi:hypothetical protein FHU40_004658 [Nocardioides soli]|uniref:Uncharacterized protein n=1 Tax=Nocardioides soli TaxID=1036020 RepID=A0A7W4VZY5_9ACTN|nr:hypothetical protein [Nocardioides soli]